MEGSKLNSWYPIYLSLFHFPPKQTLFLLSVLLKTKILFNSLFLPIPAFPRKR